MNRMPEHNRYLRGMSAWAGFKKYPLEYVREERKEGKSKYTLKKMLRLASDGAISMSGKLLKYVGGAGAALTLIGGAGLITSIIIWIVNALPSVLLLSSLMCFFTGLLLLALGILGAYIGRIYDETKGRPLYVIKETLNYKE
jgi:dolichol-phosphate mannosyltransferase